jgi:hypothetical protein
VSLVIWNIRYVTLHASKKRLDRRLVHPRKNETQLYCMDRSMIERIEFDAHVALLKAGVRQAFTFRCDMQTVLCHIKQIRLPSVNDYMYMYYRPDVEDTVNLYLKETDRAQRQILLGTLLGFFNPVDLSYANDNSWRGVNYGIALRPLSKKLCRMIPLIAERIGPDVSYEMLESKAHLIMMALSKELHIPDYAVELVTMQVNFRLPTV